MAMFRYPSGTPRASVQTSGAFPTPGSNPFAVSGSNSSASKTVHDAAVLSSSTPVLPIKPPKPPERPLVPYMRFSRKMWSKVRQENPERQLWDIGKVIGQMWREAADEDKSEYQAEYDLEKVEYDKALKTYHNSAAYQAYLTSKNRAKMQEKAAQAASGAMATPGSSTPTIGTGGASQRQPVAAAYTSRNETSGVVIQPVDEEDGENQISLRRLSAVRFERNHRLIAELFSPNVVTDSRTVISQQRMDTLRRQAQSLTAHQQKLEDELKDLEEKFVSRKRRFEEAGQDFADQLKKVCEEKPAINEEAMVAEATKKLAAAYKEYLIRQQDHRLRQEADRKQMAGQTPILYQLTSDVNGESSSTKNEEKPENRHANENGLRPAATTESNTEHVNGSAEDEQNLEQSATEN